MIKADKGKVELNGKGAELIAEFAMIYKSLLEKISKEVIMFSLKLAEEAEESKDFISNRRILMSFFANTIFHDIILSRC